MKVCHVCKAECDDAAELCPVCGADLTAEIAAEKEKEEKIINTPVLLATLDDVVSAEILKDLLQRRVFFPAAIRKTMAQ